MHTKNFNSDPIAVAKRKSVAARSVGVGNRCTVCGENRPNALIAQSEPMICHECRRRSEGGSIYDLHHVAGRRNHDLKIPVPVNDHRAVLSEAQYEWPKATRQNPDGSPLLALAACIRGIYDTILYLLEKLLLWAAELAELLDDFLVARLGRKWWSSEDFIEFASRRSEQ